MENFNFLEKIIIFLIIVSFFSIFLIKNILGVDGFAITPILNGFIYFGMSFIVLLCVYIKNGKFILRKSLNVFFLAYIFIVGMAFAFGVINHDSIKYLIAWLVYFSFAAISYLVGCSVATTYNGGKEIFKINLFLFAIFILSIFFKSGFSYILLVSISILNLFYSENKKVSIILFVIAQFTLTNNGFSFNFSRAGMLAVLMAFLVSAVYLRHYFKLFLISVITIIFYLFILLAPLSMIESLPSRNLQEGAMLLRGDSLDNHLATAQRFYEVELVTQEYKNANILEHVFGLGYGKTLDMTSSDDTSVLDAALEGQESVNNVHFLPFAIYHKMGLVGVLFFIFLVAFLVIIFLKDSLKVRKNKVLLFCYIYLFSLLMYSLPASNYLISNPLWPMVLGFLIYFRNRF